MPPTCLTTSVVPFGWTKCKEGVLLLLVSGQMGAHLPLYAPVRRLVFLSKAGSAVGCKQSIGGEGVKTEVYSKISECSPHETWNEAKAPGTNDLDG